jgi:hypothetical protein
MIRDWEEGEKLSSEIHFTKPCKWFSSICNGDLLFKKDTE